MKYINTAGVQRGQERWLFTHIIPTKKQCAIYLVHQKQQEEIGDLLPLVSASIIKLEEVEEIRYLRLSCSH